MSADGLSPASYELLAADLLERTRSALVTVLHLAVDTGVSFQLADVLQLVEDGLPEWYPAPTASGAETRREVIGRMAADLLHDLNEGLDE